MRIERIRIGSFGAVRDRDYRLGDGMTVLYGPNESGKTSTMEFIRTVLSPSRRRNLYPSREKTDSGVLDVLDDDGNPASLELSYKDVRGAVPDCVAGMDPDLYREIFAMDPGSLDKDDRITSGEIKTRFLTLPGGENMPSAMRWAEDSAKDAIGVKSNSNSRLRAVESEIGRLRSDISEQRSRADAYGTLAGQLAEKQTQLERAKRDSERDRSDRDLAMRYRDNEANYSKLAELRGQRSALGDFVKVTGDDLAREAELRRNVAAAESAARTVEEDVERARESLGGRDPRKVSTLSDEISRLPGRLEAYRSDRQAASKAPSPAPRPAQTQRSKGPGKGLLAAGAALFVVGVVLAFAVSYYASVISLVGVVAIAFGLRGRDVPVQVPQQSAGDTSAEDARRRMEAFESQVRELCEQLDVRSTDVEAAVSTLMGLSAAASDVKNREVPQMKARMEVSEARSRLSQFLSRFGGEQGFAASKERTSKAREIDTRIEALVNAISSAGLDPNVPECPVRWEDSGIETTAQQLSREIGAIEAEMKGILDMTGLESDMDSLQSLEAERREVLARGAVSLLAAEIARRACSEAYGGVQPGVVRSADRYLSAMTGPGHSLAIDPVTNDVSVVSEDGVRGEDEWSSGLRAQVLLSLKLAIAREMGGGKVPVILDDVLLPFDSERKAGAVRALAGVSEEMQVVMFTCDAETRDIASSTEGVTVLGM